MINHNGLLYIEPRLPPRPTPLVDELTCRMVWSLRAATDTGTLSGTTFRKGDAYRGWHTCSCGAGSSNVDYLLPSGEVTNSLCIHYLAYHRHEIPPEQLARVAALPVVGTELPTEEELVGVRMKTL